ncbi:hypothetical protein JP75_20465 [Devosia riboflavina]|uniref:Uncharacterized protein n=1 Tax=Devosia riboflavina TaxID=46914 RepID=A0A087LY43_9HYPH|nr:hypothetical protein [Devosia riboflavina]KFL29546.1 hypothetical protein JP75_20465 [Devosia riboflavina]
MDLTPVRTSMAEFARSADGERYREILRRVQEEIKKRDRENLKAERDEETLQLVEAVVIMATESELVEFGMTLDHYDAAAYEALANNEKLIDESRERLREMYEKAYVLPDGRRVFESDDGVHVFDEHGVEIAPETVSADELGDNLPSWEQWSGEREAQRDLLEDRAAIIEFQNDIVNARERVEAGEMTKDELEELKSSLEANMPDSVRAELPAELQPAAPVAATPEVTQEADANWRLNVKLDMPVM